MFIRYFVVLSLTFGVSSTAFAIPPQARVGGNQPGICATEAVWKDKRAAAATTNPAANAGPMCTVEGSCDDPAVRDATAISPIKIRIVTHVITGNGGTTPDGLTQADVDAQIAQMGTDFAPYGVSFEYVGTRYHQDNKLTCIPKYDNSGRWYSAISNIKNKYAENPSTTINIFVSCQDQGRNGTLLGIGTFPWDADALTSQGGVWMNAKFFAGGERTLTHEMGHTLGLWHTHHGVTEMSGCTDDCYENAHPLDDPAADFTGDFCKDTPATPRNYECADPSGTDCNGANWGVTATDNYMGYAPDSCINHFSTEQSARVHCWTQAMLPDVLVEECLPTETDEVSCDGIDNDCDGSIDEGLANACGGCGALTANPGDACGQCGSWACDGENALTCSDPGLNACGACGAVPAEICDDSVDNDCDGETDDADSDCAVSCLDRGASCTSGSQCCSGSCPQNGRWADTCR